MNKRYRGIIGASVTALALSADTVAAEPVTPDLTDKLRQVLQQEMRSVQSAMATIHTAMVTGAHDAVASNAQQIHDSFILQQTLTEEDRKDLISLVPQGFIELDREFHQLAAALAEAGRQSDTAEQQQLYTRMTHSCVACHGRYVSERFPRVGRPQQ